jgi:hypothetical protein
VHVQEGVSIEDLRDREELVADAPSRREVSPLDGLEEGGMQVGDDAARA